MKYLLSLILTFLSITTFAAPGDPFDLIQDGYRYHCVAENSHDPGKTLDCVDKAYAGPFTRDEATELCSGAFSVGPAECAIKAYMGPFTRSESLLLCKRTGTLANAECAIRAYAGPYTREQAISMCRSNAANLINKALKQLLNEGKTDFERTLKEANHKAFLKNEMKGLD